MPAPHRVVQWRTGNVGAEALRAILEHPDLELAEPVRSADVATAIQAVNAIVPLCEARAGLRTFLDLPLVRGSRAPAQPRPEPR
jgi:hypothetical protein